MNKTTNIVLSLALISALGFGVSGCAGSGNNSNDDSNDTLTETLVGYIADGGIEGLTYRTSSSSINRTTTADGKYEFKSGDTVLFYLGGLQLGESIKATKEPITPMKLYNVDENTYEQNSEVVNLLRLLQTIDSDSYHGNGITIDSETVAKFKDVQSINLSSESSVQNILKNIGIQKTLVDVQEAKNNMNDTLAQIATGAYATDDNKTKFFNKYTLSYFLFQKAKIDNNTATLQKFIDDTAKTLSSGINAVSNLIDPEVSINPSNAMLTTAKDILFPLVTTTLHLQKSDEAAAAIIVNLVLDIIKLGFSKNDAEIEKYTIALTEDVAKNGYTLAGVTFKDMGHEKLAQYIKMVLYTYESGKAFAELDMSKLSVVALNMGVDLASMLATVGNLYDDIKDKGNMVIAQEYLRLYYTYGESNSQIVEYIKEKYSQYETVRALSSTSSITTILEAIAQYSMFQKYNWYTFNADEYNIDTIKNEIKQFKYNFELSYLSSSIVYIEPDNTATSTTTMAKTLVKKTNQTKSYNDSGDEVTDNFLKDDGYYQKGLTPNYTRASDVVTDELTGLMWQDDEAVATVTKQWLSDENYETCSNDTTSPACSNTSGDTAATYCSDLTLSGYSDWRLPTSQELEGIVDYSRYSPAIDTDAFQNVSSSYYWSSTTNENYKGNAWGVGFNNGYVDGNGKDGNGYVRCVRAGQ